MSGFKLCFVIIFTSICVFPSLSETSTSTMLQLRDSVTFAYSGTNLFLDLIRRNGAPTIILEGAMNISTRPTDSPITFRSVAPLIISYVGFGICIVVGILFIILMPIIGLIFCCARSCGKCGGRVKLMDSKKDPCKRVAYTICVVLIVTVQLVAIVLAFINHFLLHEALVNPDHRLGTFSQLNRSLTETEKSLNEMFKMAVNTSSVNLDGRKARFMNIVDGGLREFQNEFTRKSKANLVMSPITELQTTAAQFKGDSENVQFLVSFNDSLTKLIQQLPTIRQGLTDALDPNCPLELHLKCTELMQQARTGLKVRYTIDMFQPEELNTVLQQLQRHLTDLSDLNEFRVTLNGLSMVVKTAIEGDLDRAWTDLAQSPETREKLARSFEDYLQVIYSYLARIRGHFHLEKNYSSAYIRLVEFHLYGGIALLCIPVLIFLLIYLGLCFGTCGHRPYEEAGVCNRGVGANLLLAGVGFIFLFSTILMLACTVLFMFGGPVQTELCRYLTGHIPNGPRLLDDHLHQSLRIAIDQLKRQQRIQQQINERERAQANSHQGPIRTTTFDRGLAELELIRNISRARLSDAILTRCETEPFVDAISGGQFNWPVLYEPIQAILQELIDSFQNVDLISPINQTVQSCSDVLTRVSFLDSINFTTAVNQANLPLTHIDDLEKFVSDLRSLNIDKLQPHIDVLVKDVVSLDKLRPRAHLLYTKLNSFPTKYEQLKNQLTQFRVSLTESVQVTMRVGLQKLRPLLEQELQLAVIATWRDIPCQSLRLAVKGGVDAVCVTTLMPLNAFWAGLGLTLLLFIPLIIFTVKLAGLYRKTEKYSPDYDEPDYISYQGFYMRPTSDYNAVPQKPLNKKRKHKANPNTTNPPKRNSANLRSNPYSRYHQVSVYPYDAYE